jgi:nibrin
MQYKFGAKLHALLELAGAKYLHVNEYCTNSQVSAGKTFSLVILLTVTLLLVPQSISTSI